MTRRIAVGDFVVFGKRHKGLGVVERFFNYDRARVRWLRTGRKQKVRVNVLRIPTPLELLALQAD